MKGSKFKVKVIAVSLIFLLELGAAYRLASGSSSDSFAGIDASEALIRKATDAGMDATVLAELLRTKQPVVVSNTNAQGMIRITTYTLTPDGTGINSRTVTEHQPTLVNRKKNSNLGAVPIARGSEDDWEWIPGTRPIHQYVVHDNVPSNTEPRPPANGYQPRTFTTSTTTRRPDGRFGLRPSRRNIIANVQPGVIPKTTAKTEVDDHGRTVTTTTKFHGSGGSNTIQYSPSTHNVLNNRINPESEWLPGFDPQESVTPKSTTKPRVHDQGRKVSTRKKTSTSAQPRPTTPKPISPRPITRVPTPARRPSKPTYEPKEIDILDMKTTTPFPSLEEFLNSQYKPKTTTPKTTINSHAQQPIDDAWLRRPGNSYNLNPNSNRKVTIVSRTYNSDSSPSIEDFNNHVRQFLLRSGITDENILNAIHNTRLEKDGHVITTTYQFRSPRDDP